MNGKFEDKLVRLAFGETNAKESAALEKQAQSDPEALKTLTHYRQVRSGLDLLIDVPPDQLSKERLRDAILGQGLKPLPVHDPVRWGWAWMPATAFTLVFGWLTVRHLNAPPTQNFRSSAGEVAFVSHKESSAKEAGLNFAPIHSVPSVTGARHPVAKSDTVAKLVQSLHAANSDQRVATVAAGGERSSDSSLKKLGDVSAGKSSQVALAKHSDPIDAPANNAGKLVSINSPMVMINPEKDNDSGAQTATEVDSASNVVVGG